MTIHNVTKHQLVSIFGLFVIWRTSLTLIGVIAPFFLKYQPSFPYAFTVLNTYHLPQWVYSWANFDGVHYIKIAEQGYEGTGLIQAFFPLYPILITITNFFFNHTIITGLLISNFFFLCSLVVWFSLIKQDYSTKIAWLSTFILLSWPSSLFFGALYSESLFIFLVLSSFLSASQKRWIWAAGFAFLATATRLVGIFLVFSLLAEFVIQSLPSHFFATKLTKKKTKSFFSSFIKNEKRKLFVILCGSGGLILYMTYLWYFFKDPLYFFHVQEEFGAGRSEKIILYPQVIWRYIKILLTYRPFGWKYFTFVQEILVGVGGMIGLLLSFKKTRLSFAIFSLGCFLTPTLTGTFSSMSRYVLVCFPLYIVLAKMIQNSTVKQLFFFLISIGVLIINTMLFIQGYWVA